MTMLANSPEPANDEVYLFGYDLVIKRGPLRVSLDEPEPRTTRAILMCEHECQGPTEHVYTGRRKLFSDKIPMPAFDEFVYACRPCGGQRVWGTEEFSKERKVP